LNDGYYYLFIYSFTQFPPPAAHYVQMQKPVTASRCVIPAPADCHVESRLFVQPL